MKKRYLVFGLSVLLALALAVPALGGPSNPVSSSASSAKAIAKKALRKAKHAQNTANTALNHADAAQTSANQAETDAQTAQTAANTAQASANSKMDNLEFVSGGGSDVNSTSPKTNIAVCPTDKSPTGGGFIVGPGSGGTITNGQVTPITSSQYFSGWVATAAEVTATANTWQVTGTAECASDPANP